MTNKKGAMTRCHCEEVRQATDDEAIPPLQGNPKLEALNPFDFAQDRPKQIPISKFKTR